MVTRQAVAARLQLPKGTVTLISTHLMSEQDTSKQSDQALTAYRFTADFAANDAFFMAGDFNSEPETQQMRFLRGEVALEGIEPILEDAWQRTMPDDAGYTADADDPKERIDYIYFASGVAATVDVRSCELVLQQPQDGIYASDHLGVYCRFEISYED